MSNFFFSSNWLVLQAACYNLTENFNFFFKSFFVDFGRLIYWVKKLTERLSASVLPRSLFTCTAPRFQMPQTRQKLSWHEVISRIFSCKFLKIHITSVSGRCEHYIFKIRQTVAVISMTSQFHDFLYFIFGGFLTFKTTVQYRAAWTQLCYYFSSTSNSVYWGSRSLSAKPSYQIKQLKNNSNVGENLDKFGYFQVLLSNTCMALCFAFSQPTETLQPDKAQSA